MNKEPEMTWEQIMKLRSAYNHGHVTPETRKAASLYMKVRRKKQRTNTEAKNGQG